MDTLLPTLLASAALLCVRILGRVALWLWDWEGDVGAAALDAMIELVEWEREMGLRGGEAGEWGDGWRFEEGGFVRGGRGQYGLRGVVGERRL